MNVDSRYISTPFEIQSLLTLKERTKPVLRVSLSDTDRIDDIYKLSKNLGLFVLIKKLKLEGVGKVRFAYFSIFDGLPEKAYEAEKNRNVKEFGRLLGYPECCIDEFINSSKKSEDEIKKFGFRYIINSYLNTKGKPSFYCNNLFNFESKLVYDEIYIYRKNQNIFSKYQHLFLIEHIPCSFDCKESIKFGKRTLELLRNHIPKLAEEIVNALKRPVLYFDYFNWLVFDGIVNGNELKYEKVLPYESLFPKEKLNVIKKGNKIKVSDDKIQVFKDENLLLEISKEEKYKGILIDFS